MTVDVLVFETRCGLHRARASGGGLTVTGGAWDRPAEAAFDAVQRHQRAVRLACSAPGSWEDGVPHMDRWPAQRVSGASSTSRATTSPATPEDQEVLDVLRRVEAAPAAAREGAVSSTAAKTEESAFRHESHGVVGDRLREGASNGCH